MLCDHPGKLVRKRVHEVLDGVDPLQLIADVVEMKYFGSLSALNFAKDLTETGMENVEATDEEADEVEVHTSMMSAAVHHAGGLRAVAQLGHKKPAGRAGCI